MFDLKDDVEVGQGKFCTYIQLKRLVVFQIACARLLVLQVELNGVVWP